MNIENKFLVGVSTIVEPRDTIHIPRRLPKSMTRTDALNLAAWIAVLCEREPGEFEALCDQVRAT